ncbi:MAG: hypothetical protein HYT87_17665 [Nitrospirae bacterium]|nr:hypothetical protein [Nitrospirota bacterium]
MAMRINDDSPAIGARNNINRNFGAANLNIGRLSSGNRIQRAGDDPANLVISQRLKADIVSQDTAIQNINQAAPQLQTADSALSSQQDILVRQRELAMQAANGTTDDAARSALNNEFQQLGQEFDRVANTTEVGGNTLANGGTVSVQAGTTAGAESQVNATIPQSTTATRGADPAAAPPITALSTQDLSSQANAQEALRSIDTAMNQISIDRGNLGASINRLEVGQRNLENQNVNTRAANSQIADTDFANEVAALTRNKIVGRAGIAAAAQFNNLRGSALRLMGGGG